MENAGHIDNSLIILTFFYLQAAKSPGKPRFKANLFDERDQAYRAVRAK